MVTGLVAYIMDADGKKECEINVELIKRAVSSVENISSNLKFVSLSPLAQLAKPNTTNARDKPGHGSVEQLLTPSPQPK